MGTFHFSFQLCPKYNTHTIMETQLQMWGTYSWAVSREVLENEFPRVGVNSETIRNGLLWSESLYQLEVLYASCKGWYRDLLPVPVGAQALPCNSTAEALDTAKLIACVQVEVIRLTLITRRPSGVVLCSEQEDRQRRTNLCSISITQIKWTLWSCFN